MSSGANELLIGLGKSGKPVELVNKPGLHTQYASVTPTEPVRSTVQFSHKPGLSTQFDVQSSTPTTKRTAIDVIGKKGLKWQCAHMKLVANAIVNA